jgi:hypothetical protein
MGIGVHQHRRDHGEDGSAYPTRQRVAGGDGFQRSPDSTPPTNAAGNFLGWGAVVPLYAVAILTTRAAAVDRMVGPARRGSRWLVGAAQPSVVGDREYLQHRLHRLLRFMLSMGIALLRRRSQLDEATQASARAPS